MVSKNGQTMNEHDKNNLDFLLSISTATLKDWYEKTSSDDIEYAIDIIAQNCR
jgi:hypothetical protein